MSKCCDIPVRWNLDRKIHKAAAPITLPSKDKYAFSFHFGRNIFLFSRRTEK